MRPETGMIVEGRVTGIMKFGAFVALPDGSSGLVHISEIANAYVADVNDFLHVGDPVTVKVIAVTPDGKINLSIKQALPPEERRDARPMREGQGRAFNRDGGQPYGQRDSRGQSFGGRNDRTQAPAQRDDRGRSGGRDAGGQSYGQRSDRTPSRGSESRPQNGVVSGPSENRDFENKLKKFMQDSDSRISDNPIYADHNRKTRKR